MSSVLLPKMRSKPFVNFVNGISLLLVASLIVLSVSCNSAPKFPEKNSKAYSDVVSAFYVGLSALQVGDDVHAESRLSELTRLVPGEPAGWANWGILALRQRNYDAAAQRFQKAQYLAPNNDQIYSLMGLLESQRGNAGQALIDLRKAIELNPKNLRATYQLAEETERQGAPDAEAQFQKLVENILNAQPNNLAASLELARVSAKQGEAATVKSAVEKIAAQGSNWPPEVQRQLKSVQTAVSSGDLHTAATQTTFLRNVLMRVPDYRLSLRAIKAAPGEEAEPFTRFLLLKNPVFRPAPPDLALAFDPKSLPTTDNARWNWIGAISLGSTGVPVVAEANGREVHLASGAKFSFPGGSRAIPPTPKALIPVDFNYDFKTDLVLAGAGGVRLMRQDSPGAFTDVTPQSKLPKQIVAAPYTGAWAVDIEADGDLDIVLGARVGVPTVLRNNGDGTFLAIHPFTGISGLCGFAWADFDGDGNPDAAIIDGSGKLHMFMNERQGQFRDRPLPSSISSVNAIAVADANNDGILDLVAVQADGSIVRISDKNEGESWTTAEIAKVPDAARIPCRRRAPECRGPRQQRRARSPAVAGPPSSGPTAGGPLIWLGDEKGGFTPLNHPIAPPFVFSAADVSGNGHLDLLGLSADGQPVQSVNHSSQNYHWQVVRPHAVQAVGDQRINPFGVGGEVEVRSGLLVQKQPITGPELHFGLGQQTEAEVVRVVWPNGTVRAEFGVKADQDVVTEQRLKASCPSCSPTTASKWNS